MPGAWALKPCTASGPALFSFSLFTTRFMYSLIHDLKSAAVPICVSVSWKPSMTLFTCWTVESTPPSSSPPLPNALPHPTSTSSLFVIIFDSHIIRPSTYTSNSAAQ